MKILVIIPEFFPIEYGAERAVKDVLNELKFEHRLTIFTSELLERQDQLRRSKFDIEIEEVFPVNKNKFIWISQVFLRKAKTTKKILEFKPDLIWAILPFPTLLTFDLNLDIPTITTVQGGDIGDYEGSVANMFKSLTKKILKNKLQKSTLVSSISPYLSKILVDEFDIKSVVIPNPVSKHWFESDIDINSKFKRIREKFDFIILTTSRLEEVKGIHYAIEAFMHLPKNICFLIAGTGSQMQKYKEMVEKLNINDQVFFLGYCQKEDLKQLYQISDLYIRLSKSEGMGISFLEAAASNLPVITSKEMKVHEFLHSYSIFVERDPLVIANEILGLLEDENRISKLQANAYKIAREYLPEKISRKYHELFITK